MKFNKGDLVAHPKTGARMMVIEHSSSVQCHWFINNQKQTHSFDPKELKVLFRNQLPVES